MRNLDTIRNERDTACQRMFEAAQSGDAQAFQTAFMSWADMQQETVLAEARGLIQANDQTILSGRGVRVLTSVENQYYQNVIDAMRTGNPKQALSDLDVVLPKTVIDMVFEDIAAEHPILDAINFQNTGALIEMIISTSEGVAAWGELCSTIDKEVAGAFTMIPLALKKLSAFIPVCKAMLDLGPEWLDRYVRAILTEALATGLEEGIVDGDGKGKPIGMTRKLSGAVDDVYARKTPVPVNALDPATYGTILSTLSKGPNDRKRPVANILMVVNPADYFTKVFPATTIRTTAGSFNNEVFPFPTTVIQSAAVPEGHAVFGLGKRYFMGLGTSKGGGIEYSDEYKFLEDQRVYLIKLYGNGRALDENAFVYADISGLKPTTLQVEVMPTA